MSGYKPKKWPTYALSALEDSVADTLRIETECRNLQSAIADGDRLTAVMLSGDIRQTAQHIREALVLAKAGTYS